MKTELPDADRDTASEEASSDALAFAKLLALYQRAVLERADGLGVLEAMELCAEWKIAAPDWLLKAFSERLARFNFCEVRTLDEAFGVERPKSFNLIAARQKMEKMHDTIERFEQLRAEGHGAEQARQTVANELRISVPLVKKYQAEWAKRIGPPPASLPTAADRISSAIASALAPAKPRLQKKKKRS